MPQWDEFPVTAFCGATTLAHAVLSQVNALIEARAEQGMTGLELASASLADFRSHPGAAHQIQTVTETIDALRREGKPPHVLIFGEAGDGKSTLLRKLGSQYCREGLLPILIRARDWEEQNMSLRDYLRDVYLVHEESDILRSGGDLLWEQIVAGNAPLLIDGLDETERPQEIGTRLTKVLQAVQQPGMPAPIVLVTSRRQGYRNSLRSFVEVEMRPFDYAGQAVPYIRKRLQNDADTFLARLENDRRMQALVGNGLMLAMLCTAWEARRRSGRSDFDLPISRGELYDWAVRDLLAHPAELGRKEHVGYIPHRSDLKRAILGEIAFHAQFCHRRTQQIPEHLVRKALDRVTRTGTRFAADWPLREEVLEDIVRNSELLTRDASGTSYRFFHPTFQEYFAAQHLVDHWDAEDWRDWLPTCEEWPVRGYPDALTVYGIELSPEKERDFLKEFRCPICHNLFPPFPDLLALPIYRETFLLMVGLLHDADREQVFLNGITDVIPLIYGYETETYHTNGLFAARLNTDTPYAIDPFAGLRFGFFRNGAPEETTSYLDMQAFLADVCNWQIFAIEAIARCSEQHPAIVIRAISGLLAVDVWQKGQDSLRLLGRARNTANAAAAVKALIDVISHLASYESDRVEEMIAATEQLVFPDIRETAAQTPADMADILRISFAIYLASIGTEEAQDYLLGFVNDEREEPWTRYIAAYLIYERACDAILPHLLPIFASMLAAENSTVNGLDPDAAANVRRKAVDALIKIGSAEAFAALATAIRDRSNSDEMRIGMIAQLNTPKAAEHTIVFDLLTVTYEDSDNAPIMRHAAATVFGLLLSDARGRSGNEVERGIAILEKICMNKEEEATVRLKSTGALGAIYLSRAPRPQTCTALCSVLDDSDNAQVLRREAVLGLGALGCPEALPSLKATIDAETTEPRLREFARLAMKRIRSEEGILVDLLYSAGGKPEALPAASRNFMRQVSREFVINMLEILVDKTAELQQRIHGAELLETALSDHLEAATELKVYEIMCDELKDPQNAVELLQAIIRSLPTPKDDLMLQPLLAQFNAANSPSDLKQTLAWALGNAGMPAAAEPLLRELQNPDNPSSLRCSIIRALTKIDADRARETLEQIACDLNEWFEVRKECVKALLELRDREREKQGYPSPFRRGVGG